MEISETEWRAWRRKGQARERHRAEVRWTACKWIAGLGLLFAAAIYSDRMPFEIVIRCLVGAGAVAVICKVLQPRPRGVGEKQ